MTHDLSKLSNRDRVKLLGARRRQVRYRRKRGIHAKLDLVKALNYSEAMHAAILVEEGPIARSPIIPPRVPSN